MDVTHVSPCYAYRGREDGESDTDYVARMAAELDAAIMSLGSDQVIGFVAEPVVGATLGAVPAVPGYFKAMREVCDRHGVLLILDEVMCGMGRAGHFFACEADGIAPDIACIAKGLGAGYQPIGAMLCTGAIYQAIRSGSGFFQHGHTYLGHPVAAAAGRAVLKKLIEQDLIARAARQGETLRASLTDRFGQHAHVGDIRGRGLFLGLEIVEDRSTKTPFDPKHAVAARIKSAAFDAGLICYPMSGTRDGLHGDHVLLAPPFIIGDDQIEELTDKLALAIDRSIPS